MSVLDILFLIGLQACNNGAGDSGEGCVKVLTYVVLPQGKIKNLSIFFKSDYKPATTAQATPEKDASKF